MGVKVLAGDYQVRGRKVKVKSTTELKVDPPDIVAIKGEDYAIVDEDLSGKTFPPSLSASMGPVDTFSALPGVLVPGSPRVYSADTDGIVTYQEGKDYRLEAMWSRIWRNPKSAIPPGSKVTVDYEVYRQRVDIVEIRRDGAASIKKGRSLPVCPDVPEADSGAVSIAAVYVRFGTTSISSDNIYPQPTGNTTWHDLIRFQGREHLSHTIGLLRGKKPVSIVCWGDSVTSGYSASDKSKCFVSLLGAALKKVYPGTQIMSNAGVCGTSTDWRLSGLEKEVLSHNPDLITVEFVNDTGYPADKIASNYADIILRARQKNPDVEFIIITPNFTARPWIGDAYFTAVEAMRKAAADNRVALADVSHIWAGLREIGIPYEILLANAINHPNDLGHQFFAETLMELLAPK